MKIKPKRFAPVNLKNLVSEHAFVNVYKASGYYGRLISTMDYSTREEALKNKGNYEYIETVEIVRRGK